MNKLAIIAFSLVALSLSACLGANSTLFTPIGNNNSIAGIGLESSTGDRIQIITLVDPATDQYSLAFSVNGNTVIFTFEEGQGFVLDANEISFCDDTVITKFDSDDLRVTAVDWNQETDSIIIAAVSSDHNIIFYHIDLKDFIAEAHAGNEPSEETIKVTNPLPILQFVSGSSANTVVFSPDGSHIAFTIVTVPESFNIRFSDFSEFKATSYVTDLSDCVPISFTKSSTLESNLVWSHDGAIIAYSTNQDEFMQVVSIAINLSGSLSDSLNFPEIHFYNIASRSTTTIDDGHINFSPRWLQTDQIVYMSMPLDEIDLQYGFTPDIRQFDIMSGESQILVDGISGTIPYVEASPDGTKIAYPRALPEEPSVALGFGSGTDLFPYAYYMKDISTGEETLIYDIPAAYTPIAIGWVAGSEQIDISYIYLAPEMLSSNAVDVTDSGELVNPEAILTEQYIVSIPVDEPQSAEIIDEQQIQNPLVTFILGM